MQTEARLWVTAQDNACDAVFNRPTIIKDSLGEARKCNGFS